MTGIITRNVSITPASACADRPEVTVTVRAGQCRRLEDFCKAHGVTPLQFLPVDAQRMPGAFVGVFAPTVYVHGTHI